MAHSDPYRGLPFDLCLVADTRLEETHNSCNRTSRAADSLVVHDSDYRLSEPQLDAKL
jgi:hypothetical protein